MGEGRMAEGRERMKKRDKKMHCWLKIAHGLQVGASSGGEGPLWNLPTGGSHSALVNG